MQDHELQEVANALRTETGEKRKRGAESADDYKSSVNKRVSPNNKTGDHRDESLQDYSQNGSGEHASTAAAALGIYPTMTVPQPTDISFATQNSDSDRNDHSFMDPNSQDLGDQMFSGSSGSRGKPAVGSEEWHKVRKDNHKEGKLPPLSGQHCTVY